MLAQCLVSGRPCEIAIKDKNPVYIAQFKPPPHLLDDKRCLSSRGSHGIRATHGDG
jgi:hypothetical protein